MTTAESHHDHRASARRALAEKLISLAASGAGRWEQAWRNVSRNRPLNAASGRGYEGGNRVNLILGTPWHSPGWLTKRQISDLGGLIRDTSPTLVEFWKQDDFWKRKQLRVTLDDRPVTVLGQERAGVRVLDGAGRETTVPMDQVASRVAICPLNPDGFTRSRMSWDDARQDLGKMVSQSYWVYNLEQVDGIDEARLHKRLRTALSALPEHEGDGEKRALVADMVAAMTASGMTFVEAVSNQPRYSVRADTLYMPKVEQFKSLDAYIAALAHEMAHATGAGHRLGRFVGGVWGGERDVDEGEFRAERATEELRAEMAAAMLCAEFGVEYSMSASAAYLDSWMSALKDSEHAAYGAAKDAATAADFVLAGVEQAKQARLEAEEGQAAAQQAQAANEADEGSVDDQSMVMGF